MDKKRVIIIDDEMVLGQLLQAAFATLGGPIEVAVVPSAEQAASVISGRDIHLIVSDVKLPGKSGLDLTRELKNNMPDLKVILVSGLNDPLMKDKAIRSGADAYFPKPVEMRDFLETASRLLGLSTQTHPLTISDKIDLHSDLIIDALINLRQELFAQSVTLMEFSGKIIVSAGDFPDDGFSVKVLPYLLSAITNLQRLSSEMAVEKPENLFSVRGNQYDMLVSTLDSGFLLLVIMKKSRSSLRLAIAFDAISTAIIGLQAEISQSSRPSEIFKTEKTGEEITEPALDETLVSDTKEPPVKEIDAIFVKAPKKKLKAEEVDTFWDEATTQITFSDSTGPGLLSYDQASKLGLTPTDEAIKD